MATDKSKQGRANRRKGHDYERLIARTITESLGHLGITARRGYQQRDGRDAPDVIGVPGFWIECKRQRHPNIIAAMAQAQAAASAGSVPVAITRADGRGEYDLVTMRLGEWLDLLAEYLERCRQ